MSRINGVFPVLPTPFAPDGAPDVAAFLRLADFAIEAGVDGVVFPGMASEVETMSGAERGALVAALGAHLGGRVPFIVGASHADPAESAARAREGQRLVDILRAQIRCATMSLTALVTTIISAFLFVGLFYM
jgi:4-hydroxy-tetrahydrodipicolinate synthase